jgi:hypothetical protein
MNSEDIRSAALEANQVAVRMSLAQFTAAVFQDVGKELHLIGHFLGADRHNGLSPFGHGDDATVAVSMLLRIGSELVSASADLIADGRHYAGSALIRQLVEVEYLAWAFETKDEESARWLRSTHDERRSFFTPAKLRAADGKQFRSVDYSYHCELGGHPAGIMGALKRRYRNSTTHVVRLPRAFWANLGSHRWMGQRPPPRRLYSIQGR